MAEPRIIEQHDFSGGENSSASPYMIGQKQLARVVNMVLSEHGSLTTRDGTLAQNPGNPKSGKPIIAIYTFILNPGQQQVTYRTALVLDTIPVLYNINGNPWTAISGSNLSTDTTTPPNQLLQYTNLLIITNGYSTVKSWDGTSYTTLTDTGTNANLAPPGALHLANYGGYLHVLNTAFVSGSTTAHGATQFHGPSSVQASDVNNANSWPVANQLFVSKDDGQEITGAGLFTIAESGIAPLGSLIIFKTFSTFQLSGYWGSTLGQGSSLALQKVKSDMGCVAGRTIQFLSGFGMIRLTHKGFALFDGVNDFMISQEINNRLFGDTGFSGIDWDNAIAAQATQVPYPAMYICACPLLGNAYGQNSIVFMYDLVRKSWTVMTFSNTVGALYLEQVPYAMPVVLGGDYSNSGTSKIRRYFSGDADDDGTAINWSMTPRPVFSQTPFDRSYFRRALLDVNVPGTPTPITASFFSDPGPATVKTPPTRSADSILVFDLGFIANNTYPTISGTGPITIRGLEYHVRPKPPGRSVINVGDG